MATPALSGLREVEVLRHNLRATRNVVKLNVDGLTQEDSLVQPQPAGNCLNWVMGHLVCIYDQVLPVLGQKPVLGQEALKNYKRGSAPLNNPAEALPLQNLVNAWDEASSRMDAGLAAMTPQALDAPAPFSPTKNPDETLRSFLSSVAFHQAYHAGQTGILRRIAGKKGAIA